MGVSIWEGDKAERVASALEAIAQGGGGGTDDYEELDNKPSINNVTLVGNKTLSDLGAASASDLSAKYTKPQDGIPASDLASGVIPTVHNVPAGGSAGQVLTKTSGTDYEAEWATPQVATDEQVAEAVDDWLGDNVAQETGYVLDRTLLLSNAAAPADMVGTIKNAFEANDTKLKAELSNVYEKEIGTNLHDPTYDVTGSIKSNGDVDTTATSYKTSDFIEVEQNTDYAVSGYVADGRKNTRTRLYSALYDENKAFVSGSYQNVANTGIISISSGSAKYVRICSSTAKLLINKGTTTPDTFVAYEAHYINKLEFDDESIPTSAVEEGFVEIEAINFYDSTGDVVGSLTSTGNIDPTATSYKTTAPIRIKQGLTYRIAPRLRMLAFYTDITADSSCFIERDATEKTTAYSFQSAYDGYMRVTYNTSYPLTTIESLFSGTLTKKVEEGVGLSNTQIQQAKEQLSSTSVLYNKKWAVCGDSFTNDGGTGTTIQTGKYAGKSYTYPWLIGNRCDMNIVQFFGGGRTLAFPATPGDFTNSLTNPYADWYYQNIPSDADYITIYLGINDDHHRTGGGDGEDPTGYIPLGSVDDATTASYLGAWNVVLTWLITNRPNAHIGIIVTNGIANNDDYRLGQIAIAKKYGIPYIDLNGDERTTAMLRTSNPNIPSAVKTALIQKWAVNPGSNEHPNDAAQLFESYAIENFLKSI